MSRRYLIVIGAAAIVAVVLLQREPAAPPTSLSGAKSLWSRVAPTIERRVDVLVTPDDGNGAEMVLRNVTLLVTRAEAQALAAAEASGTLHLVVRGRNVPIDGPVRESGLLRLPR